MDVVRFDEVENRLLAMRGQQVLLDADVAELYGVETKRVNEAVKNNPERFPEGYVLETTDEEFAFLRSKFSTAKSGSREPVENFDRFEKLKHSSVLPKAFTEQGLYMLATILKSKRAVQTSLAIVETFTKIRTIARTVATLSAAPEEQQKALMEKSGKLMAEVLDDGFVLDQSETTIELNFAVLKLKHTIKKKAD